MRSLGHRIKRAAARFATRKPERLWVHYCFAISVFGVLLFLTHSLDDSALKKTLAASQGIKDSNRQIILAQEILRLSQAWDKRTDPDAIQILATVTEFELLTKAVLARHQGEDTVRDYFTGTDDPLADKITEFISTARMLPTLPIDRADVAQKMLRSIYYGRGMHDGILSASAVYADLVKNEITSLVSLRDGLLIASALVLLGEALLVFWPAQYTVQTTIRKLQRQKQVLMLSKDRLRQVNERLEHLLRYDQLTGLPNRTSLVAFLETAIARRETADLQLFLFGLDGFKAINDTIGHDYGDALLTAFGAILQDCIDEEDMIARVGGDEFVILTGEDAASFFSRIAAAIRAPLDIRGRRVPVKTSIGYLTIGREVRRPMDILADAEIALLCAKKSGGGRVQAFDASLRDDLGDMQELQLELQDAILNGEIEPWFQPQIDLKSGMLHGAEVLVRWQHPKRGLLPPQEFLEAAERSGLIVDMDHAVWRSAMAIAYGWQCRGLWRPSISLNAAPDTIADPNMIERFLLSLKKSGLSANQVVIEVLETTLIESNDDMAAINIDQLAECGIALELDDFGTGYASLSKLTQLPLSGIKLDRSLIAPLPQHAADSVVRAILALAQELGLNVVAEGIEERVQARHLGQSGCKIGQGYGFGKPMRADDFTSWLVTHANLPAELLADDPPAA